MAKNSRDAYGAVGEQKALLIDPKKLKLVTDPKHPLYDERVELPIDDKMVRNIMHQGVIEPVLARKNPETGELEVVAGRQRVKNAIEANRRLKERGGETIAVPVLVKRASEDAAIDIMVSENEIRSADAPLTRAAKMRRMIERGRSEADVAVVFGVTVQTVKNTVSILEASAPVRRALDAGRIGISDAYRLSKLEPAEQKAKLDELETVAPKEPGRRRANGAKKPREVIEGAAPTMRTRAEVQRVIEQVRAWDGGMVVALEWVLGGELEPMAFLQKGSS